MLQKVPHNYPPLESHESHHLPSQPRCLSVCAPRPDEKSRKLPELALPVEWRKRKRKRMRERRRRERKRRRKRRREKKVSEGRRDKTILDEQFLALNLETALLYKSATHNTSLTDSHTSVH